MSKRNMWVVAALIAAVGLGTGGCKKEPKGVKEPGPTRAAAAEAPPPPGVLGVIELKNGQSFGGLATALDRLTPQAGAGVNMGVSALVSQAAGSLVDQPGSIELGKPMYLLWVDPTKYDPAIVWVGHASAPLAPRMPSVTVKQDGDRVVAGNREAVAALAAYTDGLRDATPERARAVLYPKPIVEAFRADLEKLPDTMAAVMPAQPGGPDMRELLKVYVAFIQAAGEQVERAELFATEGPQGTIVFRFVPRAGTTFAGFIAAQQPSDFALLSRLPAGGDENMVFAGSMKMDALLDLFVQMMSWTGRPDLQEHMKQAMAVMTGEMAGTMSMEMMPEVGATPRMNMQLLGGVTDTATADRVFRAMYETMAKGPTMKMMGFEQTVKFTPDVDKHDGVAIHEQQTTMVSEGAPAVTQTSRIALLDGLWVMAMSSSDDGMVRIRAAVDAARGKGTGYVPAGNVASVIELARKEKAGLFFYMDLGRLVAGMPTAGAFGDRKLGGFALHVSYPDGAMDWTASFWPPAAP